MYQIADSNIISSLITFQDMANTADPYKKINQTEQEIRSISQGIKCFNVSINHTEVVKAISQLVKSSYARILFRIFSNATRNSPVIYDLACRTIAFEKFIVGQEHPHAKFRERTGP